MFPVQNFGARLFRGVWLDGGAMDWAFVAPKVKKTDVKFTADTFSNSTID